MDTNFYRGGSQFIPFHFIFIYIAPVKEALKWMMYSHMLMFMLMQHGKTGEKKTPDKTVLVTLPTV